MVPDVMRAAPMNRGRLLSFRPVKDLFLSFPPESQSAESESEQGCWFGDGYRIRLTYWATDFEVRHVVDCCLSI